MVENNQTKSIGRGGSRKGSGRKVGSATKRTREIAEKALTEGITPLEVMLEAMRSFHLSGDMEKSSSIAKDAAPYMHPRLSSVEMNANVTTHEAGIDELA